MTIWARGSQSRLARLLGVHRNTLRAWVLDQGCPGEPWDEMAVRVWAASTGRRCEKPPEPALADQLAAAGVTGYVDEPAPPRAPSEDKLPGSSRYDDAVRARRITYAQAVDRERAIKLELANDAARRTEEVRAGRLVPRKALEDLSTALRSRLEEALDGLGARVARRLEWGDAARETAVAQAVERELDAVLASLSEVPGGE